MINKKGFTPLESPAIYCGDEKYIRGIIPLSERTRYKAPSFLTGFTLLEVLIVVVIIGILASLAIANYGKTKENVLDKEAFSNLKLIQAAEKGYYLDLIAYYPSSSSDSTIASINSNLKLSLNDKNWTYTVWSTGCGRATRNGGDGRSWYLTKDNVAGDPVSTVSCP